MEICIPLIPLTLLILFLVNSIIDFYLYNIMSDNHNLVLKELQNIKNELTKIKYTKKTTPIIVKSLNEANKTINDMINDLNKIKAKLETIKNKKSPKETGKTKETRTTVKIGKTKETGKTGMTGTTENNNPLNDVIQAAMGEMRRKITDSDDEESDSWSDE
jgi:hypothetical protein